jgi:hypothetical protein
MFAPDNVEVHRLAVRVKLVDLRVDPLKQRDDNAVHRQSQSASR